MGWLGATTIDKRNEKMEDNSIYFFLRKYKHTFFSSSFLKFIMGYNYATTVGFGFMLYIWDFRCIIEIYQNIHKRNDKNGR